jgi:hypothetical protein
MPQRLLPVLHVYADTFQDLLDLDALVGSWLHKDYALATFLLLIIQSLSLKNLPRTFFNPCFPGFGLFG